MSGYDVSLLAKVRSKWVGSWVVQGPFPAGFYADSNPWVCARFPVGVVWVAHCYSLGPARRARVYGQSERVVIAYALAWCGKRDA